MERLTARQQEVLDFIRNRQTELGVVPTLREIAREFGFRSMTAAVDHVRALRRKGYLLHHPRAARSHSVVVSRPIAQPPVLENILGSLVSDLSHGSAVAVERFVALNAGSFGCALQSEVFALEVRGNSMLGRHIVEGDMAVIERERVPVQGDIVAVLINGETMLKTFALEEGRSILRSENPGCSDSIPADELLIRGVMVALIRPVKQFQRKERQSLQANPTPLATAESRLREQDSSVFPSCPDDRLQPAT